MRLWRFHQRWNWSVTKPGTIEQMGARFAHEPVKIPIEFFFQKARLPHP